MTRARGFVGPALVAGVLAAVLAVTLTLAATGV